MIDVQRAEATDGFAFDVTVREEDGSTRHRVTMSESSYRELAAGKASPERMIEAAFEFLLEREPKEAILSHFDVTVISRYFPSFGKEIAGYL